MSTTTELHLPDECWEYVFGFLNEPRYLESLSIVCKQFLSITNHLRSSLTICNSTVPFLSQLSHRFSNVTSLDLTRFYGDLDGLLCQISCSSWELKSLKISKHSTIPVNGLQALAKKMKTLTSLTCSKIETLKDIHVSLIADCFPFLEELDLSLPHVVYYSSSDFGVKALSLALPKLRKVNLSGIFPINDASLFNLCKNCEFLEEVLVFQCSAITQRGIASAIRERHNLKSLSVDEFGKGNKRGDFARPDVTSHFIDSLVSLTSFTCLEFTRSYISDELLFSIANEGLPLRKLVLKECSVYSYAGIFCLLSKCRLVQHLDLQAAVFLKDRHVTELSVFLGNLISINLNGCRMLTDSAFFGLVRNCPLLSEIRMENTHIGEKGIANSNSLMDFVNPQVKSLHLGDNASLRDGSIKIFVSICPNLQLVDLNYCLGISDGLVEVLRRCHNIRRLNLASCSRVKLHGMNFEMPKLEVLNLSRSGIDDDTLSLISISCCRLLHLNLQRCSDITVKGVRQVVENCTQLREINLGFCAKVAADVVAWMVFSRPSLRKIMAPPLFSSSSGSQRKLLIHHGCFFRIDPICRYEVLEVP